MKNGYSKGMIVGAIAGSLGGLTAGAMSYVYVLLGIVSMRGHYFEVSLIPIIINFILLTAFFGLLWGVLYAYSYDLIPGKGIKKGLIFGLFIYFIKDVQAGLNLALVTSLQVDMYIMAALDLMTVGIYSWVVYGIVLGYLYKPPK